MIGSAAHRFTFFAIVLGLSPLHVEAASFAATSLSDTVDAAPGDGICADDSGRCSLRAALMESNALRGPDSITLSAGTYLLSIAGTGEDAAATGDLDIRDDLSISGVAADATIIDGGAPVDRVFDIVPRGPIGPLVTIRGVTIQHGDPRVGGVDDSGGGIEIGDPNLLGRPALHLQDVVIRDCQATFGGGIFNGFGATVSILSSTIGPVNVAQFGGGIYTRDQRPFSLVNSTVSGNSAVAGGGGIDSFFHATVTLTAVTVTGNFAVSGSGLLREQGSGSVFLSDTIVADNGGAGTDCGGRPVSSRGNNLASDDSCNLTAPTDLPNTDPQLGSLALNGGHTPTHALLPGSPAADHIPLATCQRVDQRHVRRPQPQGRENCDIGAYESDQ